jgi:hypothetical protein
MDLKELFSIEGDHLKVKDLEKLKESMDGLIYDAVFEPDEEKKKARLTLIKEACKLAGAIPASIQGLYEKRGLQAGRGHTRIHTGALRGDGEELPRIHRARDKREGAHLRHIKGDIQDRNKDGHRGPDIRDSALRDRLHEAEAA